MTAHFCFNFKPSKLSSEGLTGNLGHVFAIHQWQWWNPQIAGRRAGITQHLSSCWDWLCLIQALLSVNCVIIGCFEFITLTPWCQRFRFPPSSGRLVISQSRCCRFGVGPLSRIGADSAVWCSWEERGELKVLGSTPPGALCYICKHKRVNCVLRSTGFLRGKGSTCHHQPECPPSQKWIAVLCLQPLWRDLPVFSPPPTVFSFLAVCLACLISAWRWKTLCVTTCRLRVQTCAYHMDRFFIDMLV